MKVPIIGSHVPRSAKYLWIRMEISNNNDLEEVKISQNSAEDDEKHDQEETERE